MSFKIATQQRSSNRIKRSTARMSSSTRLRPTGYQVQRTIGNAATSRLLTTHHIQRKLTVSTPGDAAEREADRVAGEVMRMSEPASGSTVQSSPISIQRSCPKCEEELKRKAISDKDDEVVKAKFADTSGGSGATGELESYLNTSRGAGQPLPSSSRSYFEPRFGRDLRDVRLHTDSRASHAANSISAKAFTAGKDIVFGAGQYAPQTHQGQTLLAHELTHVVQQGGRGNSIQRKPREKRPCTVHAYDNSSPKDGAIVPSDGSGIGVSSVSNLVTKVNAYVDDPKNNCSCVNRLEINGHGTDGYQSVGNGNAYSNDEKALVHDSKEEHLKQLANIKFCATGLFMMIGCHVGQGKGKELLKRLSVILPGKLIGGAQHYTAPNAPGGPRVAGEGDVLGEGMTLPVSKSDPFLTSKFVRWHLTIGGKEFIINGDEAESAAGKSKLKAAEKIKVKTPEGNLKVIK